MRKLYHLSFLILLFCVNICYAQQGKNGAKVISTGNVIVNEYTNLIANATSGSSSIAVANSALNSNSRFISPLAQGDLIMIIQMQGATINGTATDSTWGAITGYGNCGLYEFSEVAAVPNGNAITLSCALKNNYTSSANVQVVRVPRYTSLTINNGGTLTGAAWAGTTGGIVTVEVQNNTIINTGGSIVATGLGFRGGIAQNTSGGTNNIAFVSESSALGGAKGEGVAGYETGYNAYGGMFGRGAPANGGGGGDQWNASGGGGGNAGNINLYTGNGNPDTSNSSWIAAWNLEYPGFAYSTSSGGGRGGYTIEWFPSGTPSPLVYPPGNIVWGDTTSTDERNRENAGGKGGRPLDYSSGRIFAGGGGGAGHEDQGLGGSGGNGGGIVCLLSYGTVSGSGSIVANGQNGLPDNSTGNLGDGCGGAGAGGTVMVYSAGAISGISVSTNGGAGGNQYISSSYEDEGPGGGGGGGYIATTSNISGVTLTANGGANGTTNSPLMTLFPPDGATKGGNGLITQINSIPFSELLPVVSSNVSICPGASANLSASGGTSYLWSPTSNLSCDTCASPVASPINTTTYYVTVSNGSCTGTDSVVVIISNTASAGTISASADPVCLGDSDRLSLTGSNGTIQWQFSVDGNTYVNIPGEDSIIYSIQPIQTTYYRVWADSGQCSDTSQPYKLVVNPLPPPPLLSTNDSMVCSPGSALIQSTGAYSTYHWNDGDTTNHTHADSSGDYWLTVTDVNGCTAVSGKQSITIMAAPTPPILTASDTIFCSSDSARVNTSGSYYSYLWNDGDTTPYTTVYAAGNYWVTVTNANGCSAISSHRAIAVYPVPSVSILDEGDTLASFNSLAYQWFFDNAPITGATKPVYVAGKTGEYAVQVTDTNGCNTLSSAVQITATGITELQENDAFHIYPNPTGSSLFVESTNDGHRMERMELLDVTGRMVLSAGSDGQEQRLMLDASSLPQGIYYLRISMNEAQYVYPVIKQ